jgi:signal peptidase I
MAAVERTESALLESDSDLLAAGSGNMSNSNETNGSDPEGDSSRTSHNDSSDPADESPRSSRDIWRSKVTEYGTLFVIALILASIIRMFVGLAFYIPSASMYPTLKKGDRVVVSRISYRLHTPHRGDVVVFRNPGYEDLSKPNAVEKVVRSLFEVVGARQPKEKNYVKRVIGLPGEKIMVKEHVVWINGKKLNEPWLKVGVNSEAGPNLAEAVELLIPPNSYFMMGDNRTDSSDSRYFRDPQGKAHPFVEQSAMVGRAFVRIFPLNRFGSL